MVVFGCCNLFRGMMNCCILCVWATFLSENKWRVFFSHREWAVTVFWAPKLCLMHAGCAKETTPPARSTKDSTPSSIIPTVSQSSLNVQFIGFGGLILDILKDFSHLFCKLLHSLLVRQRILLYLLPVSVCICKSVNRLDWCCVFGILWGACTEPKGLWKTSPSIATVWLPFCHLAKDGRCILCCTTRLQSSFLLGL